MCVLQSLVLHRLTSMGQECMIGLVFPAENDARNFHKQVVGRKELKGTYVLYLIVGTLTHSRSKSQGRLGSSEKEEYSQGRDR
jgi:hypothetical protein